MKLNELFQRVYAKQDIIAGLTLAVESVPDGMAVGALGAVNPINGVYAYMMGGLSGAFFTSSVLMGVQATSAMAVIVSTVPEVAAGQPQAKDALLILCILTGAFMLLFGILNLGNALRFVPNSVMSSFTHSVGFLIILGQLSSLTGYNAQGPNKPIQTVDLLLHIDQIDIPSLITGLIAIVLVVVLQRTRLKTFGLLVAIFLASLIPLVLGWDSVANVQSVGEIPNQLPLPFIPDLSTLPVLIAPALALAIVGVVQGAAISHEFLNPDGSKPDASGDFKGQGIANIITGFFQGMPVGGSFSATALIVDAGARTRFANIISGLGIAVILLLFRNVIGLIAMPALAGFLMVLGVGILKPKELVDTWKLGGLSRVGMVLLIIVALFVSLQSTVFLGVILSCILYIVRQSNDIVLKEGIYDEDGHLIEEQDIEPELASGSILHVQYYGSLFFASAENFENQLPKPGEDTRNSVVILNLRGQKDLDSSVLDMLKDYTKELQDNHCHLILAGVGSAVMQKLERTGTLAILGSENVFAVSAKYQESVLKAHDAANKWIGQQDTHL